MRVNIGRDIAAPDDTSIGSGHLAASTFVKRRRDNASPDDFSRTPRRSRRAHLRNRSSPPWRCTPREHRDTVAPMVTNDASWPPPPRLSNRLQHALAAQQRGPIPHQEQPGQAQHTGHHQRGPHHGVRLRRLISDQGPERHPDPGHDENDLCGPTVELIGTMPARTPAIAVHVHNRRQRSHDLIRGLCEVLAPRPRGVFRAQRPSAPRSAPSTGRSGASGLCR